MQIGDLVKNKATGELGIVTGVGEEDTKRWVTLAPVKTTGAMGEDIVYHAEYFDIISEHKGGDADGN